LSRRRSNGARGLLTLLAATLALLAGFVALLYHNPSLRQHGCEMVAEIGKVCAPEPFLRDPAMAAPPHLGDAPAPSARRP